MTDSIPQAAPAPAGEAKDTATLFAELASQRDGSPAPAGDAGTGDPREDGPELVVTPADKPAGEGAAGDAEKLPSVETPASDIWANASPEQKAALEALQSQAQEGRHLAASTRGRIGGLTTQLEQARKRLTELESGANPDAQPKPLKERLEADDVKKLREEYGDIVNPVLGFITDLQGEIDRLKGTVNRVDETDRSRQLDTELVAYEKDHPDWADYATDQRFGPWLDSQPRHIREAASRNAETIVDAAEASDVLSRFKRDMNITPPKPPEADPKPDERRKQQLEGGQDIRTKTPPATIGDVDDKSTLFAQLAKQREANRR